MDTEMQESAVRNDRLSVMPELGTPMDPASLPVSVPHGTPPPPPGELLNEVKAAEDVQMQEPNGGYFPKVASRETTPIPRVREGSQPPPAKRARRGSDADSTPATVPQSMSPPPTTGSTAFSLECPPPPPSESVGTPAADTMSHSIPSLPDAPVVQHSIDPAATLHTPEAPNGVSHEQTNGDVTMNGYHPETSSTIDPQLNGLGIAQPGLPLNGDTIMNGVAPHHADQPNGTPVPQPNGVNVDQQPEQPATEQYGDGPKLESPTDIEGGMSTFNPNDLHEPVDPSMTVAQFRYCTNIIRNLKKLKDVSLYFARPVDFIALNIPHYPTIIQTPMDVSTVERKLVASNPAKPDPNPNNPRYATVDDFTADVQLIFTNCLHFNGVDHIVSVAAMNVKAAFEKQLKGMPSIYDTVKQESPVLGTKKSSLPKERRPSTSGVARQSSQGLVRPKREVPAPARDIPYTAPPKKPGKPKTAKAAGGQVGVSPLLADQMRFCGKVLSDLGRQSHYAIASPFYEPVDYVALGLPEYPKIVKKPMDLRTMRDRLEQGAYRHPTDFQNDFKLMIKNCFAFNPAGTPVHSAGAALQRLFDEKWKGLPKASYGHDIMSEDEDEDEIPYGDVDEVDEEEQDRMLAIERLETQMAQMKGNIAALKQAPPPPKAPAARKPPKEKKRKVDTYIPPTTAGPSRPAKQSGLKKNRSGSVGGAKKGITDDDVLSFEQKKELSETISTLDGTKLERVIQIIHDGVPEIRDSTEEIELEIDLLPASVLTKLYNFVLRPIKTAGIPKRSRIPKGTGTGGLKRKSMDEDVEAEKIRVLEERMRAFERAEAGGAAVPTGAGDSDHSSDSSDNESSDSDSD